MYQPTLQELLNSLPVLKELSILKDLPAKATYKLSDALIEVDTAINKYSAEQKKLLAKYGTPTEENPDQFYFSEENAAKFTEESNDLAAVEAKITPFKFSIDDLGDAKGISAVEMLQLDWLLKDKRKETEQKENPTSN